MINTLYAYGMGLTAICSYLLGLFVVSKNIRHSLYKSWFYFCESVGTWSLGYFFTMLPAIPKDFALLSSRVSHASGALIPALFLRYVFIWLDIKKKRLLITCYVSCCILAILSLTSLVVIDLIPKLFFQYYPIGKFGYILYIVSFISWVIVAHYYMLKNYKVISSDKRNQMRYFLLGTISGYFGGATCFPLIFGIRIPPYPTLLIIIYVFTTTIAILRYRLMDIKVALTRAGVLIVTYSLVFSLPLLVILAKPQLVQLLGPLWWVIPGGLFGILALAGPFMALFLIHRLQTKRLQREEEARDSLEISGQGMIEIEDTEKLSKLIPKYLTKFYLSRLGIKISSALVFLLDKERAEYVFKAISGDIKISPVESLPEKNNPLSVWFKETVPLIVQNKLMPKKELEVLRAEDIPYWLSHDKLLSLKSTLKQDLIDLREVLSQLKASLCVPSFYQDELLGFLVLGEKKDGMYNEEEIAQFRRLARYAAIAIRNAQIIQALRQSQSSLFQAAKLTSVGELASGFAHEIKNPLAVISLAAGDSLFSLKENPSVMEKEEFLAELKENLAKIENQALRAAEIITRIREFAKPTSEDFAALSLNEVINKSLQLAEYIYTQKGIKPEAQIPSDLPRVKGISVQLEEVFINFITNSCDALENRERKEFKICASLDKDTPDMVRIEVSDNGCGIPAKDLTKMFTFFFSTKGQKGTGIGLAIVYQIIRHHQGRIEVKSEVNKGATFIIHLPIWKESR